LIMSAISRDHVLFLVLAVLAGACKTLGGATLFFHRPVIFAASVVGAVTIAFAASRVLRRNPSDGELPRIASALGNVSAAVYGTIMLFLVLTDWKELRRLWRCSSAPLRAY
jgi:hypothetical protein